MDLRRTEDYRISVIQDDTARRAAEEAERLRRQQWENSHIITQTVQTGLAGTAIQDPLGTLGVQPSGGGSSNTIPPPSRRDKLFKRFSRRRKQSP
jgi:hypothetical protein